MPPFSISTIEQVSPLANGDRLTCAELARRYAASPHLKKAERGT